MSQRPAEDARVTVEDDVVPRAAFWRAAGVAVIVIVASVLVSDGLLRAWAKRASPRPTSHEPAPAELGIVEQTLILDTRRGLDEKARQRESLRHYGWVDTQHRIASIPIDRAMDLVTDEDFMRRAFARDGGA